VADFSIPATESLIDGGVIGKQRAAEADAYLAKLDTNSVIRPRVMAALTALSPAEVTRVLGAYTTHGTLKANEMVECEECGTLTPAEEASEARNAGDECPCDGGCGKDLSLEKLVTTLVYELMDTPA
jgi:hypothetical protein